MIIYWSDEDDSFIVEVPKLSGSMAHGKTYNETVLYAETVIYEWLKLINH